MKQIAVLTDESLLGLSGRSFAPCKYKVRAFLQNHNGEYAIMFEERTGLYSFPDGSVEKGEVLLSALKREILEETGCSCDEIRELGYIYENRAHSDLQQYSYYYVVSTKNQLQPASFTNEVIQVGTKLFWCTFSEMVTLIESGNPQTDQQQYLFARDNAALKEYLSCFYNPNVE